MDNNKIVELKNIRKSFSSVEVLKGVNLDLEKGEIHALVGENGAGKSTLVKILMGLHQKSAGDIVIDGQELKKYSISIAHANGVVMIPQELSLVPSYTVAENIMMSQRTKGKLNLINWKKMTKQADEIIKRLGFSIDPITRVDKLPIAYQQLVSIIKAIAENAKVIIMDEPTSSLSKQEVKELLNIIKNLKNYGTTVIYISHLMDEIFEVSDRITVLRDGNIIDTVNKNESSQREVISLMVGEDLLKTQDRLRQEINRETFINETQEPVLSIRELKREEEAPEISFDLYPGEVVGITGLIGSGKTELIANIIGLEKYHSGEIDLFGKQSNIKNPRDAHEKGLAVVPEDRKGQGLVLKRDVKENISLCPQYRKKITTLGFINRRKETKNAYEYVDNLNIKITGLKQITDYLSGGNQQKVAISKSLATQPKILILDEPTRGIDVGTKAAIYKLIRELRKNGMSIIYSSSDVSEIPFVCDRVLLMRTGEIVARLDSKEATIEIMLDYIAKG